MSASDFGPPPAAEFRHRHIGPSDVERAVLLDTVGVADLDSLVADALPASILDTSPLALPEPLSESQVLTELARIAGRNQVLTSMIGQGYSGTVTPPVILRNVLENPAWYTAYTPYQSEISQGRLEALLTFQTMVADLTGLPIANASLLDEATAAAEAMTLCRRAARGHSAVFVVDVDLHPQTLAVLATRAEPLGIELVLADLAQGWPSVDAFGGLISYPASSGRLRDLQPLVEAAHATGALVAVAADLLALTLLVPPGEVGADVVLGSAQRFGVPMGYGGPHAAYFAVRPGLERSLPGRLVGISVDATGAPALRLALQTREQHIRRDKATSNICTAQVLLAVVAAMYACYHGAEGLTSIARHAHRMARLLAQGLAEGGVAVSEQPFFDTVCWTVPGRAQEVLAAACERGVNLRLIDADTLSASTDETTVIEHLHAVWQACGVAVADPQRLTGGSQIPANLQRTSTFLAAEVFTRYRSETAMMRYLRRLSDLDLALDRTMIPLGSCTMKLNAAVEMAAITWPGFSALHPFAPPEQASGYRELTDELASALAEITGYDAVSLQPNAGSQGEYAGLLAVRQYHRSRDDDQRDVCLIPASAHGTNAASAVLAGLRVVVVACASTGDVDLADLAAKIEAHQERLACLMITYPSTHGVYEESITEICAMVHDAGGQVYVDGANLNALVGLARPGHFGADVSHLNLHKTFCIPHGGGGPGVGPVGVRAHLAPFLPSDGSPGRIGPAVSAAPFGSAGVLPISWAYLRLMGPGGLREASAVAVLSANYLARRLEAAFPILYRGVSGRVAHECVLDLREITARTGVTVEDVAKRLIDYGFHAPTMSFPVAGTLMVEPTESEDLAELDRFVDAMLAIRTEIDQVTEGVWALADSPLRHAPHTAADLLGEWSHPYSRETAVNPTGGSLASKYWPPVKRVDNGYGDRHLACTCPPPEAFAAV